MQIDSFVIANLRNDEHFQFNSEFIQTVNKFGAVSLNIEPQTVKFKLLFDKEDEALKKINKSPFTKEVQDGDKYRDQIFRGLSEIVKANLYHFKQENQDAARKLKIVLDTYGNLIQKPLSEETSALYNLLQDLRAKDKETTIVGITEWMDELQTANDTVNNLMMGRYEEQSQKTDIVLKTARAEIDVLFKEIVARINALVVVEGSEKYAEFIKMVNVIITRYTNIVAQRAGKRKNSNTADVVDSQ